MHIKKSNNRAIAMVLTIAMLLSMLGQVAMAAPIAPDVISQSYICGMTEHTHGPECYEDQGYEYQCFKELRKTEGQGKPKTWNIIHEHNEFCYLDGALICPLKERTAHIHGESCYELPQLPAVDDSADVSTDIDEAGDGTDAGIDTQMMVAEPVLTCTLQDTSELTVHNHTEEKCLPAEHKVGLICAVPEHTHSSSCLPKVEEPKETATLEPTPIPTPTPTPVVESKEPVPSHTVTPTHTIPPTATPTETLLPTFEPTPSLDVDITEPPAIGSDEPIAGSDEPVIESEEPSNDPAEESPSDEPAEEEPGEDEDLIAPQIVNGVFVAQVQNTVIATGLSNSFTFEIQPREAYDGVIMPTIPMVTVKGSGLASFPGISFTAPGTYYFTISEQAQSSQNYRYDNRTYTLTVKVSEGENQYVTTGEYKLDSDNSETRSDYAAFINTYTVVSGWSTQTKRQAQTLMEKMTLEEKVGQLFLIHYPGDGSGTVSQATTLINKYHPGGYLVFAAMFQNGTTESVQQKIADTQAASKIPLLFTVDEEGGISGSGTRVVRVSQYPQYGHDPFKSPQELKAAGGLSAVASDAIDKAAFLKNLGLNVNHAPVADISGPSGYMYGRTWGGDGVENAKYVETLVRASENAGMATTLKHFPGYGGTSSNTHNGFAVNNLAWEDFLYNDLLPFQAGMAAGSHAVMVTHNTINCLDSNNPSSLSPAVYSMLRNEMHFDGVAMTDDLNMSAITNFVGNGQASLRALQAGADMAMTGSPDADIPVALAAAKNGTFSLADIEAKCLRILCWKIEMGLIDENDIPIDPSDYEARWFNGSKDNPIYKFGTFDEMWALVERYGGTVSLFQDIELSSSKTVKKSSTLDLQGHSINYTGTENAFIVESALTITDSVGEIGVNTHYGDANTTGYFPSTKTLEYSTSTDGTIEHVDFSKVGNLVSNTASSIIYVNGGTFTLMNGRLENNGGCAVESKTNSNSLVRIVGGAVVNCNDSAIRMVGGTFKMHNGYIVGNRSKTNGGGINLSNMSQVEIARSYSYSYKTAKIVIAHNTAEFDGGGLYAYGANISVQGTFMGNTAHNNGGGIATSSGTVSGSPTIIYNNANANGGGIYQDGKSITLSGGKISNNTAALGGGIYILNSSLLLQSSASVSENRATTGGGIFASSSDVAIRGTANVNSNTATNGGGIFAQGQETDIEFSDGQVKGNRATEVGGGILAGYNSSKIHSIKLSGAVDISGNVASAKHSGVFANSLSITAYGAVKIKDNGPSKDDNLFLPEGQEITILGLDNHREEILYQAEIHVKTESTDGVIPIGYADNMNLPVYVSSVFVPDRGGYKSTLGNGRLFFTAEKAVNIPVFVVLDKTPHQVDTIKSVYGTATAGRFLYLDDLAPMLEKYDFNKENYHGESLFGFQNNDGPIVASPNCTEKHDDGWRVYAPSNTDFSNLKLYYLPNGLEAGNYDTASIAASNSFWSVKVDDMYWIFNKDVKDESMLKYIPDGHGIAFELSTRNDFWNWQLENEETTNATISFSQNGDKTKVTILDIHSPVVISSKTGDDVKYTAQYFANITSTLMTAQPPTPNTKGLEIIDTSGGVLPVNREKLDVKYLTVEDDGSLKTTTDLKRIYTDRFYVYSEAPTLVMADRLYTYNHYTLDELWVLKEGRNPESLNREDWDIYNKTELGLQSIHDLKLTNSPSLAIPNDTICIREGTIIRFVYNQQQQTKRSPVSFYDYDITDGYVYSSSDYAKNRYKGKPTSQQSAQNKYINTERNGINSPENYVGSGARFAFGNANTGTGLNTEKADDMFINQRNRVGGWGTADISHSGCHFGLVTGMSNDGLLQFKDGIIAPDLFTSDTSKTIGKTYIPGHSLEFSQNGDTYTLEAVTGTAAKNLSWFRHPGAYQIWTNDFWPMDAAPTFGANGHDIKFGATNGAWEFYNSNQNGKLPISDDGLDHNSYFGMHFSVDFALPEGYVGELKYTFFGDDDMWVFLDGRLVLDIGGIHSSVGEYVNLWDYLEAGDTAQHRLEFYYIERGASGSTCWMQFTIPDAKFLREDYDTNNGSVRIEKSVVENQYSETQPFDFTITITDENGHITGNSYPIVIYDRNGNRLNSMTTDARTGVGSFSIKDGQYAIVSNLPHGTHYTVEEARYSCTTSVTVNEQTETTRIYGGEIVRGRTDELLYINDYTNKPMMPETGGPGTPNFWWFYYGAIIMATTFAVAYLKRREEC